MFLTDFCIVLRFIKVLSIFKYLISYSGCMLRYRFTYETVLPFMFVLGVLLAYILPFKLEILKIIALYFTNFFFISAPLFIFIILTYSLSIRARGSDIAKYAIFLFFMVCFTLSIITALLFSLINRSLSSEFIFSNPTQYLLWIIVDGLLRPIPVSIIMGILTSLVIVPRFNIVRRTIIVLDDIIVRFFKLIIKILPIISISFGATFYYSLGGYSLVAYTEALMFMFFLSFFYIFIVLLFMVRTLNIKLRKVISYTFKTLAMGVSLPSSYILLAPHLKIFNDHFDIDRSVGDAIIALGAALNRAGSIVGVIISISVVAKYLSVQIGLIQYILAIVVTIVGFASPGIPGGTILVTMPVILSIVSVHDVATFSLASVATFNGISILTASTNTVFTGYITLITNKLVKTSK